MNALRMPVTGRAASAWYSLAAFLVFAVLASGAQATSPDTASSANASVQAFVQAQTAEAQNDYVRAEALYDRAVSEDASNTSALLGRARIRSWLKRYDAAIADYQRILTRDRDNPQALSGLGWTQAWSGKFDDAVIVFEYLQRVEPYYLDAQKGLAYVQLWRGNANDARRRFEALAAEDRGNPDYTLAIAQAAYLADDLPAARAAYRETLALKPDLRAARDGLQAVEMATIERRPALLILAGRSDSGPVEKSGIRMVQFSMQMTRNLRWWITHDRGVGFDGFSTDRRAQDAATTTVGGFFNYRPRLAARVEVGVRDLVDETQPVFAAEHVFFLPNRLTPKVGVWVANGDTTTQWVANAGFHRWLGERFAIEPMVYVGGDGASREIRGALLATYTTPRRIQIGLGAALGNKYADAGGNRTVNRIFGQAAVPIGRRTTFLFYGWREDTEGFDDQIVLAAGLTAYL